MTFNPCAGSWRTAMSTCDGHLPTHLEKLGLHHHLSWSLQPLQVHAGALRSSPVLVRIGVDPHLQQTAGNPWWA